MGVNTGGGGSTVVVLPDGVLTIMSEVQTARNGDADLNTRLNGMDSATASAASAASAAQSTANNANTAAGNAQTTANNANTAAGNAQASADLRTNPNMLHNWDFSSPVNQRGQSSYGTGYGIDRWKVETTGSLTLTSGAISNLVNTDGVNSQWLMWQAVANAGVYRGKTVTASLKVKSITVGVQVCIYDGVNNHYSPIVTADGIATVTATIDNAASVLQVVIAGQAGASCVPVAIKLENGTVSTLANDGPMDFGEQLLLCRRFYRRNLVREVIAECNDSSNLQVYVPSTPMRISPTIQMIPSANLTNALYCFEDASYNTPTNVVSDNYSSDTINMVFQGTFTVGKHYMLVTDSVEAIADL